MKIWLRILGGMYIVIGGLNAFLFLFILVVYGGKGGIDGIGVEEFVPVLGHLGGWVVYVLLGFSLASMVAGVGLLKPSAEFGRLALFLFAGNLFVVPFGTFIALSTIGTLFFKRGREFLFAASSKRSNSDRGANKDFAIFSRRGD
jgi:hypothetical protein